MKMKIKWFMWSKNLAFWFLKGMVAIPHPTSSHGVCEPRCLVSKPLELHFMLFDLTEVLLVPKPLAQQLAGGTSWFTWWSSPTHFWKICVRNVKLDHENPRIGVKIKHVWNHHLVIVLHPKKRKNANGKTTIWMKMFDFPTQNHGWFSRGRHVSFLVRIPLFQVRHACQSSGSWKPLHGNLT